MEFLLDTNACIAMLRGKYGIREAILRVGIEHCAVSEITIAELFYGAAKSGNVKHTQEVGQVMRMFEVIPISDSLELYGHIKSELERRGERIDELDLFIGASALQHGMVLITHNRRHFDRIAGLAVDDWEVE